MPLTHDMGLIGFHLVMFAARIEAHLMPTELFVRRPLLWLAIASEQRATILCSPNFGYRHYLKVLGDRSPGQLDLSPVRLIFNGAEPISLELCEEFMERLAGVGLKRNAMYPVYGLAEASLAVSFPPPGRAWRALVLNRHALNVGEPRQPVAEPSRDALSLRQRGQPIAGCAVRIAGNDDAELPDGTIGHILIRGENVTSGYFEEPQVNAQTFTADGWLRTGDIGLLVDGELYITGRAKEIIFVNGANYYPHDLENIASQAPGMELGKVVVAGVRPPGAEGDQLTVFVLHRGDRGGLRAAGRNDRAPDQRAGGPGGRTGGAGEAHPQDHQRQDPAPPARTAAGRRRVRCGAGRSGKARRRAGRRRRCAPAAIPSRTRLLAICNGVLNPRKISAQDNLFEIGASSLKLIEIHEQIDRDYPDLVDLTELFDYPTVAQLAAHLAGKLEQR